MGTPGGSSCGGPSPTRRTRHGNGQVLLSPAPLPSVPRLGPRQGPRSSCAGPPPTRRRPLVGSASDTPARHPSPVLRDDGGPSSPVRRRPLVAQLLLVSVSFHGPARRPPGRARGAPARVRRPLVAHPHAKWRSGGASETAPRPQRAHTHTKSALCSWAACLVYAQNTPLFVSSVPCLRTKHAFVRKQLALFTHKTRLCS